MKTCAVNRLTALAALVVLSACIGVDGEVGVTTLGIVNESDQALSYTFEAGDLGAPQELAAEVAAAATADILSLGGCFGCSDPPERMITRLTIVRSSDAAVALDLDPVQRTDWTRSEEAPSGDELDAHYTLTVTQADVDAAR